MQAAHEALAVEVELQVLPLLISIAKSTRYLLSIRLAEIDFHSGQDELIVALENHELVSVSAVAERLNVRSSTASKMIERLVQKALIERIEDLVDSRRTLIRLTSAGIEAKASVEKVRNTLRDDVFGKMPIDELGRATQMLGFVDRQLRWKLAKLR